MSLKLLSFVLSFQKRKYIKERGLQEIFVLMIPARLALQTPSVIFSRKCQLPFLGEACKGAPHRLHIPPSRRSLQGCFAPLAYPPFSAKPARVLRTACISPKVGGKKFLCAPPFPQAQKSRTNRNNPARSAPFFFRNVLRPEDFLIFEKNF